MIILEAPRANRYNVFGSWVHHHLFGQVIAIRCLVQSVVHHFIHCVILDNSDDWRNWIVCYLLTALSFLHSYSVFIIFIIIIALRHWLTNAQILPPSPRSLLFTVIKIVNDLLLHHTLNSMQLFIHMFRLESAIVAVMVVMIYLLCNWPSNWVSRWKVFWRK